MNLYFKQLFDYMRWEQSGSILAADSWNAKKLAQHAEEAYQLGKNIK